MKRNIVITVLICLSLIIMGFGSILGNAKKGYTIIDDNQTKLSKDTFKLDIDKKDVVSMIKRKNLKLIREDKHGTEGNSIYCEDIRFLFNKKSKVIEIFVYNNKTFKTTKGLMIGDKVEKIKKLYGNNFRTHEEMDATIYQYKFKNNYFSIIVTNDIITGWGIHKSSNY